MDANFHFSLTTPRINRLLRPLRNRCTAFASVYSATLPATRASTSISTTYSSRSRKAAAAKIPHDSPPLSILLKSGNWWTETHADKHTVELSQKLYGVGDCFKNIVKASFGISKQPCTVHTTDLPCVMSLAAMCSIVVGEHIQSEQGEAKDRSINSEVSKANTFAMDEIIELVPLHYRRWTLVSHALTLILETCPHHPTLLTILLETALTHGLEYESSTLLRALLLSAVTPKAGSPPICHPAHSKYLVDLRTLWSDSRFNERAFVRILTEILIDVGSAEVWSCKAMIKFALEEQDRDTNSFLSLVHGLLTTIVNKEEGQRRGKQQDSESSASLRAQLGKWLHLSIQQMSGQRISTERLSPLDSDTFHLLSDVLTSAWSAGLHIRSSSKHLNLDHGLAEDVICLATYSLSISQTTSISTASRSCCLLRNIRPISSTYHTMIAHLFRPIVHCDWSPTKSTFNSCRKRLDAYAKSLRANHLFHLEASLWACALRYIENSGNSNTMAAHGDTLAIRRWRQKLIDNVDDAERRSFGLSSVAKKSGSSSASTRSRPLVPLQLHSLASHSISSGANYKTAESEWEWEEVVGCWALKSATTPTSRKRVKSDRPISHPSSRHPLRHDSSKHKRQNAFKSSSAVVVARSQSLSGLGLRVRQTEVADAFSADQNHSAVTSFPTPSFRSRGQAGFVSLLSNALLGRTNLHPRSTAVHEVVNPTYHRPSTPGVNRSRKPSLPFSPIDNLRSEQPRVRKSQMLESKEYSVFPASDDDLNLFACS